MTREEWDKLTPDEQYSLYQRMAHVDVTVTHPIPAIKWEPMGDTTFPNGFPPVGMIGDMVPIFYDGQWWGDWTTYHKRRVANGDEKP
jgi:hypothetical protein